MRIMRPFEGYAMRVASVRDDLVKDRVGCGVHAIVRLVRAIVG